MDQSFLRLIREIEFDRLTAAEAVELRTALREAVGRSEEWFAKLASGFEPGPAKPTVEKVMETKLAPTTAPVPAPRRRGRPPKAKTSHPATTTATASGSNPAEDHPPIMSLAGSYVGESPDPSRPYALPKGHPRAAGQFDATNIDADFTTASRKRPEFN